MTMVNDLRICENCGNAFSRKVADKIINRCPACNVWKKEINAVERGAGGGSCSALKRDGPP